MVPYIHRYTVRQKCHARVYYHEMCGLTWSPGGVEVVEAPWEDNDVVDIEPASHDRGSVAHALGEETVSVSVGQM